MAQINKLTDTDQINVIDVKVIKYISDDYYIVGDNSGFIILVSDQKLTEGQGYKLIKPKFQDDQLKKNPKFSMIKAENIKTKNLSNYETERLLKSIPKTVGTNVNEITNDLEKIDSAGVNSISGEVFLLVCNISRLIEGRFGNYKIITVKDIKKNKNDMNLYRHCTNMTEKGEIYKFSNVKVTSFKKEGEIFLRVNF